jgi:antitoxin MazE
MFMTIQVLKKWGNSPAVRIPATIMQSAKLVLDQAVEVRAEDGRIIIEPAVPAYTLDDLLNGITAENRHGEFDFGIAQGREQF